MDEVKAFLRGLPLLAECGSHVLEELARRADTVVVPCGEYLFREGEPADWMAIVRTGRLEVWFETAKGETLAGTAGRAAALGELALLTHTTRSASVRAVRDSELVTIGRDAFDQLLTHEPAFAVAVARNLGQRLRASVELAPNEARATVFALFPLAADVPLGHVTDELVTALGAFGRVACVDALAAAPGAQVEVAYAQLLERCETEGAFTVLVVREPDDAADWARFCLRSSDRVVLLTRSGQPPTWAAREPGLVGRDLVFVDAPTSAAAMRACVDTFRPRAHHLLRNASFSADVSRLARRLTGRSTGLVLSGGGARGLAHIGVIERLLDAGVEIDSVGGCSMGAFVGSMLALGWEPARMLATCRAELVDRHPFNDYTVPRVSLIRARKARAMLTRMFGRASIEELARSTFIVSSDLETGELVVHTRGFLGEAVGASMSVPGLVPPLAHGGRFLVDGGLLDNLPVDVMAREGNGPVIAVDVMRRLAAPHPRRGTAHGSAPSILETLSRATFLGSHDRAKANRELADAVITPAVGAIGLLQFDRLDEAVACGRRAADEALACGLVDTLAQAGA